MSRTQAGCIWLAQYIDPPAPAMHCWPAGHTVPPEPQRRRHSLVTHTRPMPHWLSNWHVLVTGVHRPAKHWLPIGHIASLVHGGTVVARHEPSTHTVPSMHCALLVHAPGVGMGIVSIGATHRPVPTPASPPDPPRQIHPRAQSALVLQTATQPTLVQICPAVH